MVHGRHTFWFRHSQSLAPHLTGFPFWNVLQIIPMKLWPLEWSPSNSIAGCSQAPFWSDSSWIFSEPKPLDLTHTHHKPGFPFLGAHDAELRQVCGGLCLMPRKEQLCDLLGHPEALPIDTRMFKDQ